jgi:hypothetical protein
VNSLSILGLKFWTLCKDSHQALQDGQQVDYLLVDTPEWILGSWVLSCSQTGWTFGGPTNPPTATPEEAIRAQLVVLSNLWTKRAQELLQVATRARREHDQATQQHHEVKTLLRMAEDMLGSRP